MSRRAEPAATVASTSWWQAPWAPALAGSLLLFAAQPPLAWWPLAWLAPAFWCALVGRPRLEGWRPYLQIWLAGLVYWLASLHWLRLPHPATSLGWVALSMYLACYLPAFVALARWALHRWNTPLVLAAPTMWLALEVLQSHLFTGFNMASVGQTQFRWILLIQIADLAGAHGVSFLVVMGGAALARGWVQRRQMAAWRSAAVALIVVLAAVGYGQFRLAQQTTRPGPRVALIQGSIDTEFRYDPDETRVSLEQLMGLSQQALAAHPDIDLIVWPETMYREPLLTYDDRVAAPADAEWTLQDLYHSVHEYRRRLGLVGITLKKPVVVGLDRLHYGAGEVERYNAAQLVWPDGRLGPRYEKMHPVMFGEYIPLGNLLPWIYSLTPLASGLTPGKHPVVMEVDGTRLAPNICYESILPHLVRRHVRQLRAEGHEPDVLVNLTNDGWFWGSSELDMHLACTMFRAIECRKPVVVAANTGFSASIDSNGRVLAQGPRRKTAWLVADVRPDNRRSPYLTLGNWPLIGLLALCFLFGRFAQPQNSARS